MKFEICPSYSAPLVSKTKYLQSEYSIFRDVLHVKTLGGIVINEVVIYIGADKLLQYADGYCPNTSWVYTCLEAPSFLLRQVKVDGVELDEYQRCTHSNERWKVHADITKNLLCIGDHSKTDNVVCFFPGILLSFDNDCPVALWFIDIDLSEVETK